MPAQRRDYIISQIELLGKFVARLARTREEAGLHEAIALAQHLQEKLFARPPAEFLRLDVADQMAALRAGEAPATGDEKCLTYATLLRETAQLYAWQGREELAFGARQLALQVALGVALPQVPASGPADALVRELTAALGANELHPPLPEQLDDYLGRRSP